ncbi:MAG: hypothetical protein JKY71_00960 [Alphaproteobacteria bacterium]|nr:hypothetical protein [Alphaproteobacteria bacterium]
MELKTLKALALTSATVIGLAMAGPAYAQQETLTTSITTSSAITTNVVNGTAFGTYLVVVAGTDTPTLTMSTDGSNTITPGGTGGGSQLVFVSGTPAEGALTVETPAPSVLDMDFDNTTGFTDFADAEASLTRVDYETATESGSFPTNAAATETITVVAGATPEPIAFGGVITFGLTANNSPADAAHSADVVLDFAYP